MNQRMLLHFLLAGAIAAFMFCAASSAEGRTDKGGRKIPWHDFSTWRYNTQGVVLTHFDGDTTVVREGGEERRIRLIGIDAPEFGHSGKAVCADQPYAGKAKLALESRLPKGAVVEIKVFGDDAYGRLLGEIFYEGSSVNLWLVRNGYAEVYGGRSVPAQYREAEKLAKAERLGIWADEKREPPRKYRRRCR
ncbi:MAG: thermonuclease family protein [Nitrospinae bacterium]|nr:thermonuclease family protein [Nitrospinota bacterium]